MHHGLQQAHPRCVRSPVWIENNKNIVKINMNVAEIRNGWFEDVWWRYYDRDGRIQHKRGVYLIYDNGYLRWPQTIPPYVAKPSSTVEGYFSANLESVCKDVECTFWNSEEAVEDTEWWIYVP
jgi:hypothetical protein